MRLHGAENQVGLIFVYPLIDRCLLIPDSGANLGFEVLILHCDEAVVLHVEGGRRELGVSDQFRHVGGGIW